MNGDSHRFVAHSSLPNPFFSVKVFSMITTYKLDTRELESAFIDAIRTTYPNQMVEIEVRDEAETEWDETAYLNSTAANRKHLDEAMANVAEGKLITFSSLEEARKCAEEWAANN